MPEVALVGLLSIQVPSYSFMSLRSHSELVLLQLGFRNPEGPGFLNIFYS